MISNWNLVYFVLARVFICGLTEDIVNYAATYRNGSVPWCLMMMADCSVQNGYVKSTTASRWEVTVIPVATMSISWTSEANMRFTKCVWHGFHFSSALAESALFWTWHFAHAGKAHGALFGALVHTHRSAHHTGIWVLFLLWKNTSMYIPAEPVVQWSHSMNHLFVQHRTFYSVQQCSCAQKRNEKKTPSESKTIMEATFVAFLCHWGKYGPTHLKFNFSARISSKSKQKP